MKKSAFTICLTVLLTAVFSIAGVFAFEGENLELIEPAVDAEFVIMKNKQTKKVEAEINSPLDFGIIPVLLIGDGTFSASLSRMNTTGDLVYIYLIGFGSPKWDFSVSVSPVEMKVRSLISEGWGFGFVVHGILSSPEEPPYEYNVSLSF